MDASTLPRWPAAINIQQVREEVYDLQHFYNEQFSKPNDGSGLLSAAGMIGTALVAAAGVLAGMLVALSAWS